MAQCIMGVTVCPQISVLVLNSTGSFHEGEEDWMRHITNCFKVKRLANVLPECYLYFLVQTLCFKPVWQETCPHRIHCSTSFDYDWLSLIKLVLTGSDISTSVKFWTVETCTFGGFLTIRLPQSLFQITVKAVQQQQKKKLSLKIL